MHTLIHPKLRFAFLMPLLVWACGGGADLAGPEGADDQLTQPRFAATASTTQSTTWMDVTIGTDNWQNCFGEEIHFTGPIHVVFHETVDAGGGVPAGIVRLLPERRQPPRSVDRLAPCWGQFLTRQ